MNDLITFGDLAYSGFKNLEEKEKILKTINKSLEDIICRCDGLSVSKKDRQVLRVNKRKNVFTTEHEVTVHFEDDKICIYGKDYEIYADYVDLDYPREAIPKDLFIEIKKEEKQIRFSFIQGDYNSFKNDTDVIYTVYQDKRKDEG